jgi:Ca-activated chloride channel family protein
VNTPFRRRLLALCITLAATGCHPPQSADEPPLATGTATLQTASSNDPPTPPRESEPSRELLAQGQRRDTSPGTLAPPASVKAALHDAPDFAAQSLIAPAPWQASNTERYTHRDANGVHRVSEEALSTFSIDVDTASYANVRRFLRAGELPPPDAVRTEELLNYFDYDYSPPGNELPFAVHTETAPAPWNRERVLLGIGIQGAELALEELPPANLVFLLDVSGSMDDPAKLPLLKNALRLLSRQLRATDRVSIVVYAGAAGLVLEPTPGDQQATIEAAIGRLAAGGSTNGEGGIRLAYDTARRAFVPGGINRVILATDGDFNVGLSGLDELKHLVEARRVEGVSLSALGFGYGNLNDALLNELAEIGNGNSAYIDSALEARKVLVEQLGGTLFTLAADVKVQVEFSPRVAEYRLIGYESRLLAREDFNNDARDAGEIGAGHSVTALYELTLAGSAAPAIDPLRYTHPTTVPEATTARDELAFVKIRYKRPGESRSRLLTHPVPASAVQPSLAQASTDLRFAAAVAAFGQRLARNPQLGDYGYAELAALAESARGADRGGYREEFVHLARLAEALDPGMPLAAAPERNAGAPLQ